MTESERSQGRAQTACLALDGEGDDTLFIGDCGQSRAPVAGAKWVKGFVPCGLVGQSPAPSERNGNTEHVARTGDLRRIDKPRRARYTFDSSTADVKSNIGLLLAEVTRPERREIMAKASISVVKGKGSLNHNNREFVTDNVDRDRIKNNITYKCESLEDAYRHCFEQAITEYNAKQKRADRRIDGVRGYMEQIRTSKNGEKLFYENLIQVGNMRDSGVGTEQGEMCKQILDKYMRDFKERNPNLYVFNAVMHLDEQTPHLHIDYIPVAHGYKNGLQARNSLDRAFREQGVEGKSCRYENCTIAWQNGEKDHIEQIMLEHGMEREEETGFKREHQGLEQYKASMEKLGKMKIEAREIPFEKMLFSNEKVAVKKTDLELAELKLSMATAYAEEGKKFVGYAKSSLEEANEYAARKMNAALSMANKSQKELENLSAEADRAERERKKWIQKQEDYEVLKGAYEELKDRYADLEEETFADNRRIRELSAENEKLQKQIADLKKSTAEAVREAVEPLKAQIDDLKRSADVRVQKATEPLKKQIESLEQAVGNAYRRMANIVETVGMLRHGKPETECRIENLNSVQKGIINGVRRYAVHWMKKEGYENIAEEVQKRVTISKDITDILAEQEKEKARISAEKANSERIPAKKAKSNREER